MIGTLHVAKVTPRVLHSRKILFPAFRRALIRHFSLGSSAWPHGVEKFWRDQLAMYNSGVRDQRLDPRTLEAVKFCSAFPMGH